MRKAVYILLLIAFSIIQSHAQQVIWSEDFESFQSNNFIYPWGVIGNAAAWRNDIPYLLGGPCFPSVANNTHVAGIADIGGNAQYGCVFGGTNNNVLLYTPLIHLNNAANPVFQYESFFTKKVVNGKTESATIMVSTDSGTTWMPIGNAPVSQTKKMEAGFADLSPYSGFPSIRLGFRYCDSGQKMIGWMLDNFKIFIPPQKDLSLIQLNPVDSFQRYPIVGDSADISGIVRNTGAQTISAFVLNYQVGNGAVYSQSFTGLNIAPFTTFDFQHQQRLILSAATRYDLKVWVTMPGDMVAADDSMSISFTGASFIPVKTVAVEHCTGNWDPFAPQGYVYMDKLSKGDNPPAIIAVHTDDPMEYQYSYATYLENVNNYFAPFFLFDRTTNIDATVVVSRSTGFFRIFDSTQFFNQYNVQRQRFAFAKIDLNPGAFDYKINIAATVTPAVDMHGDYRLALVLTENSITGTTSAWNQPNGFTNDTFGVMGGYENLPAIISAANMKYDFVAHSISPDERGASGCLPIDMLHNTSYTCQLTAPIVSTWKPQNMRAIVLLIHYDGSDSSVLNAAQTWIPTVGVPHVLNNINYARLYPNPANGETHLAFSLSKGSTVTMSIMDIAGRTLGHTSYQNLPAGEQQMTFSTAGLASGLYYIQLQSGDGQQVLKMDVLH